VGLLFSRIGNGQFPGPQKSCGGQIIVTATPATYQLAPIDNTDMYVNCEWTFTIDRALVAAQADNSIQVTLTRVDLLPDENGKCVRDYILVGLKLFRKLFQYLQK
jgi:hypothetical protein